jgi:hypothetical protein
VLHDVTGADLGYIGVLAGVAPGPALAEEVPALVELDFYLVQPGSFFVRQLSFAVFSLKLMLFCDESVDVLDNFRVVHGKLLPAPVPFVTGATWSVPAYCRIPRGYFSLQ